LNRFMLHKLELMGQSPNRANERLAKSSPPTRSERAGSSATLSAKTAERVGHPGGSARIKARPPAARFACEQQGLFKIKTEFLFGQIVWTKEAT